MRAWLARWCVALALGAGCGAPSEVVAPPPPSPASVLILGHRGARGHAPENTLEGFREAFRIGVDGIELDVVTTADGVLVVHHDAALNVDLARLDGAPIEAPIPIGELTLAELARYEVGRAREGSAYAARFPEQRPIEGARVPTLDAVLRMITELSDDARINVELKLTPSDADADVERTVTETLRLLEERGAISRVILSCFDFRALVIARRLAPDLETSCLTERLSDDPSWHAGRVTADHGSLPRVVAHVGCASWAPDHESLARAQVDEAHALGLRVVVWTVNEPSDLERVLDLGIDAIITDYPDRARTVLTERAMAVPRRYP
ncbi:MAG: glycerophosphodiester phosphodiesterase family protein [Sandaracinaceae bacterium]